MKVALRWVCVPLSAVAVWYVMLAAGMAGLGIIDSLCPPELVDSGMCTAPWYAPAVDGLILLCTALVAIGVVLVPAFIAPAQRVRVAALAFALGAMFSTYVAEAGSAWGPFLAAAVGGSAALWLAVSRWRRV